MVGYPVYRECPECKGMGIEYVECFFALLFIPCQRCGGEGELIVFTTIELLDENQEVFNE